MFRHPLVVHIDPAIGSTNLGDEIISEAVSLQLNKIFPVARKINLASRDIGFMSQEIMVDADYVFLGGTNALSANPVFGYRQLAMGRLEYMRLKDVILCGVGWWQYQNKFGSFAQTYYNKILRKDIIHSVRDEYTKLKLHELGFENVLNTACPTMWGLSNFVAQVPDRVVITLTDYNQDQKRDLAILSAALKKFRQIQFWPQGLGDVQYLFKLSSLMDIHRIEVLNPSLSAFDNALSAGPCYIGTRLHAGIRALQYKCASYIVPIDNRAIEIAKTESLALIEPGLHDIDVGATYRFNFCIRPEVQQFIEQFR